MLPSSNFHGSGTRRPAMKIKAEVIPSAWMINPKFRALAGGWFLLIHPGFGVATAWAYKNLLRFPAALRGQPGRAQKLLALLRMADLAVAGREFYNSLEAPVLEKFPLLALFQEFLRARGVPVALMSGSGSTTFAVVRGEVEARQLENQVQSKFGACWTAAVAV